MTKIRCISLLLCLLLTGLVSPALDPTKPFNTYVHHSWIDGLPQHTIYDIAQTPDGYIWLATAEGPVRFDGLHFKSLDLSPIRRLHSTSAVALLVTSDGSLWIAFYGPGGGIVRYENDSFHFYGVNEGLTNTFFTRMAEDRPGELWVGTEDGLFVSEKGRFAQYPLGNQVSQKITSLAADPHGRIWAATEREILAIQSGATRTIQVAARVHDPQKLYFDSEGTLWIGTNHDGLYRLSGQQLTQHLQREFFDNPISTIYEDAHKVLWIGALGKGLCRLRSKLECYKKSDGLSSNDVYSVYEDREGSLWVGTQWTGLNRLNDGDFRAHAIRNSETQDVWSVALGRDESVWAGTNVGLEHFRDGVNTEFRLGEAVTAIEETAGGFIWVGTAHGLIELKNGKVARIYTTADGLASNKINALHEDETGSLWIGTLAGEGGLTRLRKGMFTRFSTSNGLAAARIHTIVEDHTHALWLGTKVGITRLQNGQFTNYIIPGRDSGPDKGSDVTSIHEDSTGDLWIGTAGSGLVRMRHGVMTFFTKADGLFDDIIWSILEDDEGSLWMTSNRGLFEVRKEDLNQFAQHKLRVIPSLSFSAEDGLITSEFNGGYQSSAVKTSDGRMWFASIQGVVEFDQKGLGRNNVLPPVAIENASLDNRALANHSKVNVGTGNLEFHFSALSFLAPEKIRYKYKLEGFDKDWIWAGNRTAAYYTNVPPGSYKFRVTASNNDGLWNNDGASFAVLLKPHLYQSWTFRVLCGLIVLAIPFTITSVRHKAQRRMERRLEKLIVQRSTELTRAKNVAEAIAAAKTQLLDNISHEIRTPINGLLGMVELIRAEGLSSQQQDLSDAAIYSGHALLNTLNHILSFSALEAGKLTIAKDEFEFSNSIASIRHMFTAAARQKNTELAFQISAEIPPRVIGDPNRFVEVLFTLVGNAVKFTEAGTITVIADVIRRCQSEIELQVCVADTGIGIKADDQKLIFEPFRQVDGSLSRKFGGTGLGLSIAAGLISLMGGKIWLESEAGSGSKFFFTVLFGLPKTAPVHQNQVLPARSSSEASVKTAMPLNILVVEDNLINQKFAVGLLKKHGCQVTVAANGREALERIERARFDLILMDIQMPVMNGLEATLEIRRLEKDSLRHIPIVALTAHASAEDRDRCLKAGIDEYLSKPIDGSALISIIGKVYRRCDSAQLVGSA